MRMHLIASLTLVRLKVLRSLVALASAMAFDGQAVSQELAKARPTGELKHANEKGDIVGVRYSIFE